MSGKLWRPGESGGAGEKIISVGELLRRVRRLVEGEFGRVWVRGEVAGFRRAASGHCYFTIKDGDAQADCAWFARYAALSEPPREGEEVELFAAPTFYEPRGRFQLSVLGVRRGGRGRLYEEFIRRKEKLQAQGWFDGARKRALAPWPRCVGIVASSGGAALRDVLKTLSRRYPAAAIVYPAPAQGADAAVKIAAAIALAGKRAECDVLLVCRGGGGIEDLWAYNSEEVAAAIFSSPIPVVTGVGHESDETIADYVADYRAATPTAAAVAAAPDREAALAALADFARRITAAIRRGMDIRAQRIDAAARVFARPGLVLAAKEERVNVFARRLIAAARNAITRREDAIAARAGVLRALDPARVLARGYAIVTRSGAAVLRASQVKSGDVVDIAFARGTAQAEIIDKHRQSAKARG